MTLTEEEKKEATQLQKEERLRRQNPVAYDNLMAKQRTEQSVSIGKFIASKPVGDASQALIDFQSSRANQPEDSNLPPTKDPQAKIDSMTPNFRPHPMYHPSVHYISTFHPPSRNPDTAMNHLMPIPASSTQVQSIEPTPSMITTTTTTTTNAGQNNPPPSMMRINVANQDNVQLDLPPITSPPGPVLSPPTFKPNPRFEKLLTSEAKKMAGEKKT